MIQQLSRSLLKQQRWLCLIFFFFSLSSKLLVALSTKQNLSALTPHDGELRIHYVHSVSAQWPAAFDFTCTAAEKLSQKDIKQLVVKTKRRSHKRRSLDSHFFRPDKKVFALKQHCKKTKKKTTKKKHYKMLTCSFQFFLTVCAHSCLNCALPWKCQQKDILQLYNVLRIWFGLILCKNSHKVETQDGAECVWGSEDFPSPEAAHCRHTTHNYCVTNISKAQIPECGSAPNGFKIWTFKSRHTKGFTQGASYVLKAVFANFTDI